MPAIDRFRDGINGTDFRAWRQDIIGRFLNEHVECANGIAARDLTRIYFGRGFDLEDELLTRQQIGICIGRLRERGVLLVNQSGIYFVAKAGDAMTAKTDLVKFAKRQVRGQDRLEERVDVAHENYALPPGDKLAGAIKAAGAGTKLIATQLGLPLPKSKENGS